MLKFSQVFPATVESEAAEEEEEGADDYRYFHTSRIAAKARIRSRRLLSCAKCDRAIDIDELYMNLPSSNMDRRRVWCDRLGFNYDTTIRRFKSWNAKPICARHFNAADVRLYASSKVRIERFALPSGDESMVLPKIKKVRADAAMIQQQRQAWHCTMCRFVCWCAFELYNHVTIDHLLSTSGRTPAHGYLCPFCRRCAYGYRTLGGFRKHIACAPYEHFLLRKVVESAVALGRDAYLQPIASWCSWREENVSMALFGISSAMSTSTEPARRVSECSRKKVAADDDDCNRPTATAIFVGNAVPISFGFSVMIKQESASDGNKSTVKSEPIDHDDNYTLLDNYGVLDDDDQQHSTIVKGEFINIKAETLDDRNYKQQEFVDDQHRMYDGAPPDLIDDELSTRILVDIGMLSDSKTIEHNMPELIEMPTTDTIDFVDDDSTIIATTASTTDDRYFLKKKANQLKMLSRQMESAQNRRRFFGPSSATIALENNDDDDLIEQPSQVISASGRLRALDRCGFVDSCCQLCGIQFYSQAALQKHYIGVHHNDEDDEGSDN